MKDLLDGPQGFLLGFAAALVSTIIVLGSFVLALTEGGTRIALLPTGVATATFTPSPSPTPLPTVRPGAPTFTPSPIPTDTPTLSPTPTSPPVAANCPAPEGWITITLSLPDTLQSVAQQYGLSAEELAEANCTVVVTSRQPVGTILNVPLPATPTPTPTPILKATATPHATQVSCGPPQGWTTYRVKSGDNLFRISLKYRVSVAMLQFANCLGSSTTIRAGQLLYVPSVPTSTFVTTATPTNTPTTPATPSNTPIPSFTATTQPPTIVPTTAPPPAPTATFTFTPMPTSTFTATPTFTPTPTFTLPPSDTPVTPSPPTPTLAPTATDPLPSPTNTLVPVDTPAPTNQ